MFLLSGILIILYGEVIVIFLYVAPLPSLMFFLSILIFSVHDDQDEKILNIYFIR